MGAFRSFVSGIAYSLGTVTPIDELQGTEAISAEILTCLKQRGLTNFCKETRATPDMCLSSVSETLRSASLTPERIDAILFANAYPDWSPAEETALLAAFFRAGFGRTHIMGLTLQGCSACGTALRVASDLTKNRLIIDNALVVLCGRVSNGSRLGPHAATINGDGAASCIISSEQGQFEILASQSQTNFGTSGSLMYLNLMAEATQVPLDRVYKQGLATYGHVHACDNLIGLKDYLETRGAQSGDHYMMLGWSPYVVSASVVRIVG